MRAAVICDPGASSEAFAVRPQREFASHGIESETVSLTLAGVGDSDAACDVHVLPPQLAHAAWRGLCLRDPQGLAVRLPAACVAHAF